MQSFQGEVPEIYKEESPLAGILSTVYIVRILVVIVYVASIALECLLKV